MENQSLGTYQKIPFRTSNMKRCWFHFCDLPFVYINLIKALPVSGFFFVDVIFYVGFRLNHFFKSEFANRIVEKNKTCIWPKKIKNMSIFHINCSFYFWWKIKFDDWFSHQCRKSRIKKATMKRKNYEYFTFWVSGYRH